MDTAAIAVATPTIKARQKILYSPSSSLGSTLETNPPKKTASTQYGLLGEAVVVSSILRVTFEYQRALDCYIAFSAPVILRFNFAKIHEFQTERFGTRLSFAFVLEPLR